MRTFIILLLMSVVINAQQYKYPATPIRPVTDEYFGVKVTDNYRWLEDLKNPEVLTWFKAQADYTNSVLDKIAGRKEIVDELNSLSKNDQVLFFPITKTADTYFYGKQLPGEQTQKVYYRKGINGKEILLFDPQKYIEGKTIEFDPSVSDDGSKLLLSIYSDGTELGELRVLDVETKKFLPDTIPHSRSGPFVNETGTEFIYYDYKSYDRRDPQNRLNILAKLHVLGKPIETDIVVASSKQIPDLIAPSDIPSISIIKDCPYIFLTRANVDKNRDRYYASKSDLTKTKINWKPLTKKEDEIRNFFVHGDDIYFFTTKGNPNFKLIKTKLDNPDLKNASNIIEGNSEWKLSYVTKTKDYILFTKTKFDLVARSMSYEFKTGKITEITVPQPKGNLYADNLSGNDNEILLVINGWNFPTQLFSYDLKTRKLFNGPYHSKTTFKDIENIVSEEVEIPSHDGVLVPLSIVYDKKQLKKDGSNVTLIEGYGAYGRSPLLPDFSPDKLPLLNRGVVLAFAHVRGGGEKGNDWYLAGKKTTKPNTWKDLNACAEYLIKNRYTSPEKLGAIAVSAGGVMIGRAITERPDLYKVAIVKVGVLNTLRFEFSPNGPANIPEFGTTTKEEEFKALYEMDSFHHVSMGKKYPAQLITTGFEDPRVESYIPAKFAAIMQASNSADTPTFLDVNYKSGHFGGTTRDEHFAQMAKEYAFLLWQTGDSNFQPQP